MGTAMGCCGKSDVDPNNVITGSHNQLDKKQVNDIRVIVKI